MGEGTRARCSGRGGSAASPAGEVSWSSAKAPEASKSVPAAAGTAIQWMRFFTRFNNDLALWHRSIGLPPPVRRTALVNDQDTSHACFAMARQIARKFKLASFVEKSPLSHGLARLRL